jgi:hypothetical protein
MSRKTAEKHGWSDANQTQILEKDLGWQSIRPRCSATEGCGNGQQVWHLCQTTLQQTPETIYRNPQKPSTSIYIQPSIIIIMIIHHHHQTNGNNYSKY